MSVIQFRKPLFSVYSYLEDDGSTVVGRWLVANDMRPEVWSEVYALWDFCENFGPDSIRSAMIELQNGFWGLLIPRSGNMCPVFCFGPFDDQTEITFLAGARWDDKKKRLRPYSAIGTAEENLEVLLEYPNRRKRE